MKCSLYLVLAIVVFSCNSQTGPKATVDIQNPQFFASYGIYLLEDGDAISTADIKALVSEMLPTFSLVDSLSHEKGKNEYAVYQFSNPKVDFTPPDVDYLQHSGHGLSEAEMVGLQMPIKAVSIDVSGTKENVLSTHIRLNALIDALLRVPSALVTDYVTYETFNLASWQSDRVAPFTETSMDITSQFTTHLYREGAFCRAVTLGLGKFCLPDISVDDISCNDQNSIASLINLVAQTWMETPKMTKDSEVVVAIEAIKNDSVKQKLMDQLMDKAEKKGLVRLKSVEPEEGDAYNTQMALVFADDSFSSPQEEQLDLLSRLFGSEDAIHYVNHDEEILAASQRAKRELPRLQKLLNDGLDPGYSLLLKAPFKTDDGGNEWMWIEVTEWKGPNIKGILQNDPFEISGLKAGAIVTANQDAVFDFVYYHPDGSYEGNETGELMSRGN